ncbi:GPP34 family phosphoprotein [Microtetraspora sp. AC03309]|uniref:GOLPH3/VPS74 family protein n=1 Tax=Microtetraspora sp. AC03309 TaxID=2779376 RepID=UPI001E44D8FC|nr:GPP34 family phosphoprotein [Microtetraspora sp. AC03309]MCC5580391.1 GPP34 family phosphoprotein [Microtetraspora sp. AC03309]
MTTTIAEEVLLLAYREDTGKPQIGSVELDAAVAGAVLAELAVNGRIDLDGTKVVAKDATPLGDDELDAALARIAGDTRERKPEWWVGKLDSRKLRGRLLARLAEHGVLSEERTRILGIFPSTRYPEHDPAPELEIRQRVERVLGGEDPDERTAVLIAVLHASKLDRKAFPDAPGKRIKEIAEGEWAGAAVKKTIASIHAAVLAGTIAATVAASASTG